jgi:hypothetical protein
MRKRFEQQFKIGLKLISETTIPLKSRDDVPTLVAALLKIYTTPEYNEQICSIIENKVLHNKKRTGREGLTIWQLFVLAEFRLALNIDYDRLHYMANYDSMLRQLLGIETESGFEKIEIGYQRILDNVGLLDDKTVKALNEVIVEVGHYVLKKKEMEALFLKTDSFVVESNVHFPTDYNLLWDASRKACSTIERFLEKYPSIEGWRKSYDWSKSLKSLSRSLGKASSSAGKNKEKREKDAANQYLKKAISFKKKLEYSKHKLIIADMRDLGNIISLEHFISLMDKHIDLIERRLIKGEKIPHEEKMFSIFEDYTEWITKGKQNPSVELGKKVAITTDQFHLIIDYRIMENESDSEIVLPLAINVLNKYKVITWSFDKGFYHKSNKDLLKEEVTKLVMPKKGKCNQEEQVEEKDKKFIRFRQKHSAIESNINELEFCGLDRCPDKGYEHFKRYVGLAVCAYNLKRIGRELMKIARAREVSKAAA